MRILVFTLFLSILSFSAIQAQNVENPGDYAVPFDKDENQIIYSDVIEIGGSDKNGLYDRFMEWGKSHYTNFDGKITDKNKDGKVPFIRFKGYKDLEYEDYGSNRIWYYMKAQFKDDRFRYSIKKIHLRRGTFFGLEKWMDTNITDKEKGVAKCKELDKAMNELIGKMTDYMKNPPQEEDDSW